MRVDPNYAGWNHQKLTQTFGPHWEKAQAETVLAGWIVHLTKDNSKDGAPPTEIVGPVLMVYVRPEAVFIQVPGVEIFGVPHNTELEVVKP